MFGPAITDNAVPMREAIEKRFHVPAISVSGADDWLGEWTFALPQGSMTDEPIYWAHLIAKQGHRDVGVIVEQSLIGESYARNFRKAAREQGLRIVARGTDRPDRAGRRRGDAAAARRQTRRASCTAASASAWCR